MIRSYRTRGKLSALDRWGLITNFITALTTFVVADRLINWVDVPAAVALLAGGVGWAVLAGRSLLGSL